MVPNGWEVKKLGELCSLNPKKPSKPDDGIVSFIAMPQLSESGKVISTKKKPYDEVSKGFTSFVDKDVLVAKITPCFENGKGALVDNLENGMGFGSTEFHVLRAKKGTHPEFIYYLTRTKELRVKGEMNMQGSAGHRRVTADYFNAYKVVTPPYSEQRKIAKILSTWDKAITTTEKLIETSKQQKKALMQQLLTGKKRLVNPETGKAFQGEWERHSMSDLVFIDRKSLGKKTPDDFEFQYISLSDVAVGSISKELEVHKFASAPSRARRVIQEGDILLSTVRPNLKGFAKVSEKHADCIASTGFSVLTPKKRVSGDYIHQYIFSSHVTGQIDSLVVGSNYPAINSSDVAGLQVYCPTYEEQQKIASVLTAADKEIEVLEAKLAHFKQEKKALMQQLLTGKKRVVI